MTKAICQVSGGYDSVAAAILACQKYEEVHGVFFNYGQVYKDQEMSSTLISDRRLRKLFPEVWRGITLLDCDLMLVNAKTPDAYIPLRNLVLASISANYAQSLDIGVVVIGNKTLELRQDDPYCFKDCSRDFFDLVEKTIEYATEEGINPVKFDMILHKEERANPRSKAEVLKILVDHGFVLGQLWTCYLPGHKPCGKCYHCLEFEKAKKEMEEL